MVRLHAEYPEINQVLGHVEMIFPIQREEHRQGLFSEHGSLLQLTHISVQRRKLVELRSDLRVRCLQLRLRHEQRLLEQSFALGEFTLSPSYLALQCQIL